MTYGYSARQSLRLMFAQGLSFSLGKETLELAQKLSRGLTQYGNLNEQQISDAFPSWRRLERPEGLLWKKTV